MPDVLVRDLSEGDKAFVARYAVENGVSQAEVMRQVVARGIESLRRARPLDRDAVREISQELSILGDPDFEEDAWS